MFPMVLDGPACHMVRLHSERLHKPSVYLGPKRDFHAACVARDPYNRYWLYTSAGLKPLATAEAEEALSGRLPFNVWAGNRADIIGDTMNHFLDSEFTEGYLLEWEEGVHWTCVEVESLCEEAYAFLMGVADNWGVDPVDFNVMWDVVLQAWLDDGQVECGIEALRPYVEFMEEA